jgi:acetylornithine/succinyldiaminopimelate/putrescine aminotransferase
MTEAVSELTAAIMVEVIQGEGGIHIGSTEYIKHLRKLCDDNGAMLIFDEIQTGFGRTGKWFACQHHDVIPDMLCIAKGFAGGVPIGAVAIGSAAGEFPKAIHGSTFGGNPIACRAALATIQFIEDNNLVERSRELGEHIMSRLQSLNIPAIRNIRGKGLMIGIELKRKAQPYSQALMKHGILTILAGPTVLRILPPLVIEKEDLDYALDKIEEVLKNGG